MKTQLSTSLSLQHGSINIVLSGLLAVGLGISGYFLYDSYEQTASLQTQLDSTKRILRTTQRELNEAEDSINNQTSELYNLNRQRERLKGEIAAVKNDLEEAVKNRDQTQEELNTTTTKLKKDLADIENQYQETTKALQSEITRTETEFKETKQALETELSENETQYNQEISKLNDLSGSLKEKYQSTQKQLENERSLTENYSEKIETLEERLAREQQSLDQLNQQLKQLNSENNKLHSEKNQLVKQYEDGLTVIRLKDTILFSSGSVVINQKGQQTLSLIAQTLKDFPRHLVSIEGHTDSKPVTSLLSKRFPTNWELSSGRATAAVRYLIDTGLPATQFQAIGFGSTRPLFNADDKINQKENRRIEILLYPPAERKIVER